jgi:hypothetical protein
MVPEGLASWHPKDDESLLRSILIAALSCNSDVPAQQQDILEMYIVTSVDRWCPPPPTTFRHVAGASMHLLFISSSVTARFEAACPFSRNTTTSRHGKA